MEQYKIKTIVNYLKNRLILSNEIVKCLNEKTISLDEYLRGARVPKSLVSTKRDINLIQLTNEEIDEFVAIVELLLSRYCININTSNGNLIELTDSIVNLLQALMNMDYNYVVRDMLNERLNRFKAITINGNPCYGINPNIQGTVEITYDGVTISNKDLKKKINSDESALLFNLQLMHRNTEILARDLFVGMVEGELRIVTPCDYYFFDMVSNQMYGITEVSHMSSLNEFLESRDLDLMVNGYYTLERLEKILGHIQRLSNMSREEKKAFLNLSVQGSLKLTEYISHNTNITNDELDQTRYYLQKYFYDRLIRKGKTDLRVVPELDHGHPLDCALEYGDINPERCDINYFMKISDHDVCTRVGHFTPTGLKYEDSVTEFEMGYQYKKC